MLHYHSSGRRWYAESPVAAYHRNVWEFQTVLSGRIQPTGPAFGGDEEGSFLRRRTLWVFGPENVHGWTGEPDASAEITVFHFSDVPVVMRNVLNPDGWTAVPLDDEGAALVRELSRQAAAVLQRHTLRGVLESHLIMNRLCLLVAGLAPAVDRMPGDQRAETLVVRAEHIMQTEPGGRWGIADLAARLGVSVAGLRRAFAARRGRSPQQIRSRIVLEAARRELLSTDRTVLDIALEFGFSSHSAFTKAYRRVWGESPRKSRVSIGSI